eukprot:TRINITY_DN6828_c0_g1_i3.p1 TRINITY_DN6828_c0_g1~~TRINITY_DN6828_c0_g1_i3.p1  ORF type:complete len:896 (-),score=230.67 TRINITY_DN6828_c0_g1_i3:1362-3956(-)
MARRNAALHQQLAEVQITNRALSSTLHATLETLRQLPGVTDQVVDNIRNLDVKRQHSLSGTKLHNSSFEYKTTGCIPGEPVEFFATTPQTVELREVVLHDTVSHLLVESVAPLDAPLPPLSVSFFTVPSPSLSPPISPVVSPSSTPPSVAGTPPNSPVPTLDGADSTVSAPVDTPARRAADTKAHSGKRTRFSWKTPPQQSEAAMEQKTFPHSPPLSEQASQLEPQLMRKDSLSQPEPSAMEQQTPEQHPHVIPTKLEGLDLTTCYVAASANSKATEPARPAPSADVAASDVVFAVPDAGAAANEDEDGKDTDEIVFMRHGTQGVQVKAATLHKLVERITYDKSPNTEMQAALILTYQSFISSEELVHLLMQRYNEQPPSGASSPAFEKQQRIVKLRVANVIRMWLEKRCRDFHPDALTPEEEQPLHRLLFNFIVEQVSIDMPQFAVVLTRLLCNEKGKKPQMTQQQQQQAKPKEPEPLVPLIAPCITPEVLRSLSLSRPTCPAPMPPPSALVQVQVQSRSPPPLPPLQQPTPPLGPSSSLRGPIRRTASFSPSLAPAPALLDFDPLEVAQQMALLEWKIFVKIECKEFLGQGWSKRKLREGGSCTSPNIVNMTERFNRVSAWVATQLVTCENLQTRVRLFMRLLAIAQKCYSINNFNSMMQIMSGFHNSSVYRLRHTWEKDASRQTYEFLVALLEPKFNYRAYRTAIHNVAPPCIPFVGIYLTDLTFIEDGNPDIIEVECTGVCTEPPVEVECCAEKAATPPPTTPDPQKSPAEEQKPAELIPKADTETPAHALTTRRVHRLINFDKRRRVAAVIREVAQYQQLAYPFAETQNPRLTKCLQDMQVLPEHSLFEHSVLCEPKDR